MKMTHDLELLWIRCYGTTYHEVLDGRRLVSWFRYGGGIYRIDDVIDIINDAALIGSNITTCEIVSAGTSVKCGHRKVRRILVRVIEGGPWRSDAVTGIALWSDETNHIRHNALHTLAALGD